MKAYFTSDFREVHRRYPKNVTLHLDPRQLGAKSGDFHLLGAHRLAVSAGKLPSPVGLDPVEQDLLNQPQAFGNGALLWPPSPPASLLLLELEDVARRAVFVMSFSLLELHHTARDTFIWGQGHSSLI